MAVKPRFRVGLVGAGHICEFHIRALRRSPHVAIVGLTDLDQRRAEELAKRTGIPAFPSLDALAHAGANVIHVLTPPVSHATVTLRALELGCHVLVEKPLATSLNDCDRIIEASKQTGKVVGVNHSLLADPFVARALKLVREGTLGEVRAFDYFRSQFPQPYFGGQLPPACREGGYPFRDIGVHGLYLAEAFLGEIEDVHASVSSADGIAPYFYSEWRTLVRCKRGTAQLHLSWSVRPQQSVLIVQGTEATLRADLFGMVLTTKRNRRMPEFARRIVNTWTEGFQTCVQVPANAVRVLLKKIRQYHGVQDFVIAFYEELAAGRPVPVTAEQARPIVHWTEFVAKQADEALEQIRFPVREPLTAKIFVTGATGFIGRTLLRRLLVRNDRIRILTRRPPSAELASHPQIEYVLGDLGDPQAVEQAVAGIDLIFHVGAAMKGGEADFVRGTIRGTQNIVDCAIKQNSRLVYISSLSVLETIRMSPDADVREEWPLEPHPEKRGWYSRAKLEAERIVTNGIKLGLQAVILRPGQVVGPGAPLITPAIGLGRGRTLTVIGSGNRLVPLIHVEDVVSAMLNAAASDIVDGSVFHLVDSMKVTQNDVIRAAQAGENTSKRVLHLPTWLVYSTARVVGWIACILGRGPKALAYRLKSAAPAGAFNCTKAEKQLQWNPIVGAASEISAPSGIRGIPR